VPCAAAERAPGVPCAEERHCRVPLGVRAPGVCAAAEYAGRGWRRWARSDGDAEEARPGGCIRGSVDGDNESGEDGQVVSLGR
jgi:hypothetical protein